MYGSLEFYKKCMASGIKPIIGLEIQLGDNLICLIAKNKQGYHDLVKLTSIINDKTKETKINETDLKMYNKDLVCIIPAYRSFKDKTREEINSFIESLKSIYQSLYLGMEFYENDDLHRLNAYLRSLDIKRVAFNNINCKDKFDRDNIEVLKAIDENKIIGFNRSRDNLTYSHFTDNITTKNLFPYEEIKCREEIVNLCNLKFDKEPLKIADYHNTAGVSDEVYLKKLAFKGLEKRNKDFVNNKQYVSRLNYELSVIHKMGFDSYFLVVYDYVKFAKNNGIQVGPGRGSAAGSLVSYVLGITNVDPIEYNLLFERFLNEERVTMPDIDLDFQDNRRDEVVEYLREKYGHKKVANIVTFSTLAARQALRDSAKVIGLGKKDIDTLARLASKSGSHYLDEMYELSKDFRELIDSEVKYKEVFRIAKSIEGLPRQTSVHAAGVVIAENNLSEILPVNQDRYGNIIVQYDMNHLEDVGLLKMDILGLKNLTIIDDCLKEIKRIYDIDLNINKINLEDENIYKLISSGNTSGIFQLESEGMKKTIKQVKPTQFIDLSSILALYRPGPREFIEEFSLRKQGQMKIEYVDESLKAILEPTYGIIVYQEQILQIAQLFAGFSLAKADILRRAMSKKNKETMLKMERDFISGAIANNYSEATAREVFNLISKFASYGFNKAHSVSYAIISAQMAYLKYYYPSIFFACVMNSFVGGSDSKFNEYVRECKSNNINLLLPSVNHSDIVFKAVDKHNIYYSLAHIKGINSLLVREIVREGSKGKFESYEDFLIRMSKYKLSKAQTFTLIDAGALDEFNYNRATLKHNYDNLEKYLKLISYEEDNQMKFDFDIIAKPKIEVVKEAPDKLILEKEVLGIFISGFPLINLRDKLNERGYSLVSELVSDNARVETVVMVNKVKIIKTRKNELMAIVDVMDESGDISLVVFPRVYENASLLLNKGNYLIVVGRLQKREDTSIIVDEIKELKIGGTSNER